jgi:hypothetical protein
MAGGAPLYKIANAAESLATHSPSVFITADLTHLAWLLSLLESTNSPRVAATVLSAAMRIVCCVPETHSMLQAALMAVGHGYCQLLTSCHDPRSIDEMLVPLIEASKVERPHAMLLEFFASLWEPLFQSLEPSWKVPDVPLQMTLATIVEKALRSKWVNNQAFLLSWIENMCETCLVIEHVELLPLLQSEIIAGGLPDVIWRLLHVFDFPLPVSDCYASFSPVCFTALARIVQANPTLAQYCVVSHVLQGLQIKNVSVVIPCAAILCAVVRTRSADYDAIFEASVGALKGWTPGCWNPCFASALCRLWRTIGQVSGDRQRFATIAVERIEKELGGVEIQDLRCVFRGLAMPQVPDDVKKVATNCLTYVAQQLAAESA